jgi:HEAT repeat protein
MDRGFECRGGLGGLPFSPGDCGATEMRFSGAVGRHALGIAVMTTKRRVKKLIEGLKDRDARVRASSAVELGEIGPPAVDAIPALMRNLRHKNWYVRCQSGWALGMIGPGAKKAIPRLIKMLKDPEADVRATIAWSLGAMGHEAQVAIPALTEAIQDERWWVRNRCRTALQEIQSVPLL